MKLISISTNKGTFEIIGTASVATREVKFQVFANGLVIFESEYYEHARAIMMDAYSLNIPEKRGLN